MYIRTAIRVGATLPFIAAATLAADIAVDARIDEVRVYAEGATIARRAQTSIPAGSHRLLFRDLPATLDTDTLRIFVGSREVRLGGVEVEAITFKDYVSPQERELRARLEKLGDERTVIQDEIATAETQLKLLDSLATTPGGGVSKPAVDATNLASVLSTMSSAAGAARTRVRDSRIRQRALEQEVQKLNADLQKIATARKQTYEIRASIDAATDVTAPVTIEYSMDDASWRWVYEGRLDTQARRVTLARQAAVEQNSGEDWSGATLTLTTANPSEDVMTPQVASLFLDLQEEEVFRKRAVLSAPAPAQDLMQEVVVTGQRRPAAVVATDYLVEYKIPGRVTVDSDGEPRLYPVAEEQIAVSLVARVIPAASRSAYLEALFKYDANVPMQGGELQLYRDGAFVGLANIEALLPGADVRLPFGGDERIQVQVRDEAKQSGEKGVVSKARIEEHRQRFDITNYHANPITIEVVDRVPVSENKDVRVEVLKGATPATQKELDGRAGVMLWKVETQPRETATVRHYYAVRYPADRELSRREADE